MNVNDVNQVTFLSDSDYSFAFNLAKTDEVFQHARDPMGKSATSYLQDMQEYKDKDLNAYRLLDPRDTYPAYPGKWKKVLVINLQMIFLFLFWTLNTIAVCNMLYRKLQKNVNLISSNYFCVHEEWHNYKQT